MTNQSGDITFSPKQIAESKRMAALNMDMAPDTVTIGNLEFAIHPGVFSPKLFCSTEIFSEKFPFVPGGTMLEVGCGTGVMPVLAIKAGMSRVLALDINDLALKNTLKNLEKHGIGAEVEVRHSDVFSSVRPNEKFDIIYWNTPFITAPHDYQFDNVVERALFDPGYQYIRRFITGCGAHLKPGGKVYLGISDGGGLAHFFDICRECNLHPVEVAGRYAVEGQDLRMIMFDLQADPVSGRLDCLEKNYDYYSNISFTSYKAADEFRNGLRILNDISEEMVSIFGSHRVMPGDPYFEKCQQLVKALVAEHYGVITGGGPGIMLAANRAAKAAGGVSVGFKATPLTKEKVDEDIYTHRADFYWLFARRFLMGVRSCGLVFFPGGYGTLNEIFEYIMLMQTDICDRVPVICIGSTYWSGLFDWLHDAVGDAGYLISARDDLGIFHIVDEPADAIRIIKEHEAKRAAAKKKA